MYVLRNCFDFIVIIIIIIFSWGLGVGGDGLFHFNIFCIVYYCFLYVCIYLRGSVEFFFFKFISKLVMFLFYLNLCKIYLYKVAVLYCVILLWWINKYFKLKKNLWKRLKALHRICLRIALEKMLDFVIFFAHIFSCSCSW